MAATMRTSEAEQLSMLRAERASLLAYIKQLEGERDDYRARVEHFRSDPLVEALEAAEARLQAASRENEQLREPLALARIVFEEVARLVNAGKGPVAIATLTEFEKAIADALAARTEEQG
jgi:hypothetical protein